MCTARGEDEPNVGVILLVLEQDGDDPVNRKYHSSLCAEPNT